MRGRRLVLLAAALALAAWSCCCNTAAAAGAAVDCRAMRLQRHAIGLELVATGVTPAGCEGGDAGVLMQQLRQLLEELPGVAGPHSVTLGGCRATSHQGSAAAAYSYALRVTACANSQADALLRKGELSCADLAWTSSDGGSQQLCSANNTVVAVRKMARPPPSLTVLPATASASLAPTWLQLVTGARIPLASALAPQLQQAYAASAWLLSGSSLIESAAGDFYEMFGGLGSDGVSLVVKPANLLAGLGSASAQLKLEYATGQASLITLRVQPPVLQGWKPPVEFVRGAVFMLNRRTLTAQLDARQLITDATGLNVLITGITQPDFGAIQFAADGPGQTSKLATYTLTANATALAANRTRLADQVYATLLVVPAGLDAAAVAAMDEEVRAELMHTSVVMFDLDLTIPLGLQSASKDDDPCKGAEADGISDPLLAAYQSTFYAHVSRGLVTVLSSDSVTLTSDINKRRDGFYYVPPCLSLEAYADTIVIDRHLTFTGPRGAKLFARRILCLGADVCTVDTTGFAGKSFSGQQALDGKDGLRPGQQGNTQYRDDHDLKGNGQDGTDGGRGVDGSDGRDGAAGGDVHVFAADLGLQSSTIRGSAGLKAPLAFRLKGGDGGMGQVGGNGGKGGDAATADETKCTRYYCGLSYNKRIIESVQQGSERSWAISTVHFVGRGCHAGVAARGGDAGANGKNGNGGSGGVLTLATSVPPDVVASVNQHKPRDLAWQSALANVMGGRESGNQATGGNGGATTDTGKAGANGLPDGKATNCITTERIWWHRISGAAGDRESCDFVSSFKSWDGSWRPNPRWSADDGNPRNRRCGLDKPKAADGKPEKPGERGATPGYVSAGVGPAPSCDPKELALASTTCPLLSPEVATHFRSAANNDQLGMMLTQGQLAFQTGKLQRAGDLTKWLLEVVPCTAEDAAAGASGEACEMRRQAAAMQAYVVAGMESRGSSMVDTPRQSLQLLQAYQCNHLLPRLEKLEASYNSYFDTKNTRAKREQALEEMLDNYVSMLEVFKQERDRLDKDAASTQRTLRELGGQREHLWRALRASQEEFQSAIEKHVADKNRWSFGMVLNVLGSALAVTAEVAMTVAALKTGFGSAAMGGSSLVMLASPGGSGSMFTTLFNPSANDPNPLPEIDRTKVAVGSEEWTQLIEPYLTLPIASNYTAALSKYSGICDAYNKALLQLEGFKLQREQKLGEESETKKKLEAAKTELARNQGDPDVPNHPDVLAAVRDAYQSAQRRALDMLYQQTLALRYITLSDVKYKPPVQLNYAGIYDSNSRLSEDIFERMIKLEDRGVLEIDITDAEEPGIGDSIRAGRQMTLYLPAQGIEDIRDLKAQVVAERVEAVLLGANKKNPDSPGAANSIVRLRHTGHAEFLDVDGQLHSFRTQALDSVSSRTDVESGASDPQTGNLKTTSDGAAFGAACRTLTIPDDNNLLLPVSPFSVWQVDVPPASNRAIDLTDVWGLRLRFFIRYRTQNMRSSAAAAGGGGGSAGGLHASVWGGSYRFKPAP